MSEYESWILKKENIIWTIRIVENMLKTFYKMIKLENNTNSNVITNFLFGTNNL